MRGEKGGMTETGEMALDVDEDASEILYSRAGCS